MIEIIGVESAFQAFEQAYIDVRNKEKRVLSIDEIKLLPFRKAHQSHLEEWKLREQSFIRFKNYLAQNPSNSLLDLACGNGWFINQMKDKFETIVGVDVNLQELQQAEKVLTPAEHIRLIYGDILSLEISQKFDIITIIAGVQYFKSFSVLINKLRTMLMPSGEVHIFDSPFYSSIIEQQSARLRTAKYYQSMGADELANTYQHHLLDEVKTFRHEVLYYPKSISVLLKKMVGVGVNPFPWIKIYK